MLKLMDTFTLKMGLSKPMTLLQFKNLMPNP